MSAESMNSILATILLAGALHAPLFAQERPAERRPVGPLGLGDPSRRHEMIADRLAEDLGLTRDQRNALKEIFDRVTDSARPLQDQLVSIHAAIRAAIRAGTNAETLVALHDQLGVTAAKLATIQSAAFGDVLKILNPAQAKDADIVYEVLGIAVGPVTRGPLPFRGGLGGPGGFGGPGRHKPGTPGPPAPPPNPPPATPPSVPNPPR
jgi:Spy/CpxP family protein refolding chaperone